MSEYIGSRISLISKSDIRYVGTLHEINSENHTVALENVTSYGTEGRKGAEDQEIPGSDIVYEYIVFRGSDVKELNIVSGPGEKENQPPKVPDDPAILGSARPAPPGQPPHQQPPNQRQFRGPQPPYPQQQQFGYQGPPNQFPNQPPNQPRFQGPGGPHGFPGQPGAVPGYGQQGFGPPPPGCGMGYGPPPPGQGFPNQPPPGHFNQNQQMPIGPPGQQMNQQRPPQQMQGQQQPAAIGSKQGTPQPGQQGPPPQAPGKPIEMSATPGPPESAPGPPPPVDSKPPVAAATAPAGAPAAPAAATKPAAKANSRVAVPLPTPNALGPKPPQKPTAAAAAAAPPPPAGQTQSIEDATQAATAAVAAAMAKLGPVNQSQSKPQNDNTDNLTQKVNQMRLQDNQNTRGRGRGRGTSSRGGRRDSQKAVEVPKEDFDFQSSNAKFNKEDFAKEANTTGSPITSPNGDKADPLAATNGHLEGDKEQEVVIPPQEKSYDKKSSFFDNISSDLKDRFEQSSGDGTTIDGRAMRTQERTKNMETFGQGSVDGGYRGGYRGRGRGYNNYRGTGGYRGGRGGYDNRGGGYRGRGRGDATFA